MLVACPELNGPWKQEHINRTALFTRAMIINYVLPRPKSVNVASKWLMKQSFFKACRFKDVEGNEPPVPIRPVVRKVTYKSSPYLQLGVVFEDEGRIDGVYRLHETLYNDRLGYKLWPDQLLFQYGDCKTTSFIRRI
jgi:hypothetical protein